MAASAPPLVWPPTRRSANAYAMWAELKALRARLHHRAAPLALRAASSPPGCRLAANCAWAVECPLCVAPLLMFRFCMGCPRPRAHSSAHEMHAYPSSILRLD